MCLRWLCCCVLVLGCCGDDQSDCDRGQVESGRWHGVGTSVQTPQWLSHSLYLQGINIIIQHSLFSTYTAQPVQYLRTAQPVLSP